MSPFLYSWYLYLSLPNVIRESELPLEQHSGSSYLQQRTEQDTQKYRGEKRGSLLKGKVYSREVGVSSGRQMAQEPP